MEAAGALGRGGLSTYLEAAREAVRSRSRTFWIVAGLTVAAAVLRFATLGLQSYHHDEIVTASRILRGSFWHAMDAVGFSESAPPLYYAAAWLWTQATGTGEVGLRSFSALAGVATVPVAFLIGRELRSSSDGTIDPPMEGSIVQRAQRVGIVAAALVAVNPMLVWYSQEARAYALLVLLTSLSLLYFDRGLEHGRRRDLTAWGLVSGLALATHYFAIFPIAAEAAWLLYRRRRGAFRGAAILAAFGLLLTPLAIHQMSY
ncbi:MAG TPA: glycosyltransferase family 39 protein, partial [Solirubrobacterales bacterium]|nr:glycosyltransferase family 39 protein [Solirubrobacterales bacterium]